MNTLFLLMARFEKPQVALQDVCEEYFGVKFRQAALMAAAGRLPCPVFKLRDSERAAWMIDLRDLAKLIDDRRAMARDTAEKLHTVVLNK